LNTDLDIPDERQGCDTGTVAGGSSGRGRKEMKVREYGGGTPYTYMK
jgi:hypothetical protein